MPNLKSSLLQYLRFKQQADYLATEVDNGCISGVADVLCICGPKVHEYEIKISMADFRRDFKKGEDKWNLSKHDIYNLTVEERPIKHTNKLEKNFPDATNIKSRYVRRFVPDTFTFVIPAELKDKVLKYLDENNYKRYGVIVFDPPTGTDVYMPSTYNNYFIRTAKRKKDLWPCYHLDTVKKRIARRAGSELATNSDKIAGLLQELNEVKYGQEKE